MGGQEVGLDGERRDAGEGRYLAAVLILQQWGRHRTHRYARSGLGDGQLVLEGLWRKSSSRTAKRPIAGWKEDRVLRHLW